MLFKDLNYSPCGSGSNYLPVSVKITGQPGCEQTKIRREKFVVSAITFERAVERDCFIFLANISEYVIAAINYPNNSRITSLVFFVPLLFMRCQQESKIGQTELKI